MDVTEIKGLVEAQHKAWEEFKKTNDARLAAIEKGQSPADFDAKLAKINERIDETARDLKAAEAAANRPNLSSEGKADFDKEVKGFNAKAEANAREAGRPFTALSADQYSEYKAAMVKYIRGDKDALSDAERKAINVGTDSQGGYLVSDEMEAGIMRVVGSFGAMRQLATVRTIGAAMYEKVVKTSGVSAGGWGGETTAPTETNTQAWAKLQYQPGTLWAEPRITQQALEDSVMDVEGDLINEIGVTFAEQEGDTFIDGDGVSKPRGIAAYTMVANASYAWGSTGFIASGGAAGFAASNPSDALIDLQHALKRQYRSGASWLMNDATLGAIRKFKDGNGLYLWAPSALMQGAVGQLLGHPVVTDDFMADLGTNTFPVAFADFRRAYLIVDRKGLSILRDPYTAKPYVKFYARKRVGGGIQNFEAVKFLKCST
jgi:HK97 family phage major capsid protein